MKKFKSFYYRYIRFFHALVRFICGFVLVLSLSFFAFASSVSSSNVFTFTDFTEFADISFATGFGYSGATGTKFYDGSWYNSTSVSWAPASVSSNNIEDTDIIEYVITPNGSSDKAACIKFSFDLNDSYIRSVSSTDTFSFSGNLYLLSDVHNRLAQSYSFYNGLDNNLDNFFLVVHGYNSDYKLFSFRFPLKDFVTDYGFQVFDDHSHSYLHLNIQYQFTSSFTFDSFDLEFNGVLPYSTATVQFQPFVDWSSGSPVSSPVQYYCGPTSTAPRFSAPVGGSSIDDLDSAESSLVGSYDSAAEASSFFGSVVDSFTAFVSGFAAFRFIFSTFLGDLPLLTYLLNISLSLGLFAFVFSLALHVLNSSHRAEVSAKREAQRTSRGRR